MLSAVVPLIHREANKMFCIIHLQEKNVLLSAGHTLKTCRLVWQQDLGNQPGILFLI